MKINSYHQQSKRYIVGACLLTCLILACTREERANDKVFEAFPFNTLLDDSAMKLYVPYSLLDSFNSGEGDFMIYYHNFLSKRNPRNSIVIHCDQTMFSAKRTNDISAVIKTKVNWIKKFAPQWKVIASDTFIANGKKMGVIECQKGNLDTGIITTSVYALSSFKNRWYTISINTDSTNNGRALYDSIPIIIGSVDIYE